MEKRPLGKTGLEVSVFGFGGYRIDNRVHAHLDALRHALLSGVNFIDTSTNYSDGNSEILIGDVLSELENSTDFRRGDFVLASKAGYIQGKNLETVRRRELSGDPYPEITNCSSDLKHCIHPGFLKDQITESISRMKCGYLDVFFLHNPEYFLMYSTERDLSKLRKEYYGRLRASFEHLEEEIKAGRIRSYGISSNTFGYQSFHRNFTSLEEILKISPNGKNDRGVAAIQLPLNLKEKEGLTLINQAENGKSAIKLAAKAGLGIVINRPLNAIVNNRIERLADFKMDGSYNLKDLQTLFRSVDNMAETILYEIKRQTRTGYEKFLDIKDSFGPAKFLMKNLDDLDNPVSLNDLMEFYVNPRVRILTANVIENEMMPAIISEMAKNFLAELKKFIFVLRNIVIAKYNLNNMKLHGLLNNYMTQEMRATSLQAKALTLTATLPYISSVLVGMRQREYAEEVTGLGALNGASDPEAYWFMER